MMSRSRGRLPAAPFLGSPVGPIQDRREIRRLRGRLNKPLHVPFGIGGQTMILATNGMYSYVPQALWTVRVDLTRVPQDEYHTLTQGDLVTVTGVLSDDNSRVVGTGPRNLSRHSTAH